jgi:hypothetical protein
VPSDDSISPPLKAWLKEISQMAVREEAMVAVHWKSAALSGEVEHSGDTKTILTHFFAHQDALGAFLTDAPTLIFLTVQPPADPDTVSRRAQDTALIDAADFSYPTANAIPVAAHYFTLIRVDVSDLDAAANRMINHDCAPAVILLDKDHGFAAYLKGRGQLSESSLLPAMRKLLPADQQSAIDTTLGTIKPLLKDMRALGKKMKTLSDQLTAARADAGDSAQKHQDELSKQLDDAHLQYQDLGAQIGKSVNPGP